ncbi:hypothetical protein GOP47_0022406 [Adiantum capillus-veneris]|uniref:Uncharacterized protein n=1 Tax=Adiantum capillus-veneris TaxID=13818 RepID=A0A9D4Z612_ADICA|nr:hypothetical protein GOP47_0022406 [Adiantum capillus-veneris]
MEARAGEWTHPDVSLHQLLSLIRAFVEMLLLASGFQPSGSPAFWRSQDVLGALGWASLIEQIIAKISVREEDKYSRETLNRTLQGFMLETSYPEGLPKLSCEILGESKKLLIHAMSHALGSYNGQIESLVTAAYKDEKDWEEVLEQIKDRFTVVKSTKSVTKALHLAAKMPVRSYNMCGCQHWRQESLSYLLDGRTLYKVCGAIALFNCSEMEWKTALQSVKDQLDMNKSVKIAELCCLHMCQHRRSVLITRLMQPCDRMSCSTEALRVWHPDNYNMREVAPKEMDAVAAFLHELAQSDKGIWWSLPPILVAAALTKGSLLYEHYHAHLARQIELGNEAESSCRERERCAGEVLKAQSNGKYNVASRSWCLQFMDSTVEDDVY